MALWNNLGKIWLIDWEKDDLLYIPLSLYPIKVILKTYQAVWDWVLFYWRIIVRANTRWEVNTKTGWIKVRLFLSHSGISRTITYHDTKINHILETKMSALCFCMPNLKDWMCPFKKYQNNSFYVTSSQTKKKQVQIFRTLNTKTHG